MDVNPANFRFTSRTIDAALRRVCAEDFVFVMSYIALRDNARTYV